MAGEAQDQSIWPLPKFHFSVDIGDQKNLAFQEVSGLDTETQIIEYRAGNSKDFSTVKMPGIKKVGNVTLKKGIFVKDNKFWVPVGRVDNAWGDRNLICTCGSPAEYELLKKDRG